MAHDNETKAPRLYLALSVIYYLCTALLVLAIIMDVGNGLGNFLHAPIGIKDNPPDPGPFVDLARALIVPLILGYIGLRVLRWLAKEMGWVDVMATLVSLAVVAVLGSSIWAMRGHPEYIPGSVYLIHAAMKIWAFLFGTIVVLGDAFFAWEYFKFWRKERKVMQVIAGLGFLISTFLFLAAIPAHFLQSPGSDVSFTFGGWGFMIGVITVLLAPKNQEQKMETKTPNVSE